MRRSLLLGGKNTIITEIFNRGGAIFALYINLIKKGTVTIPPFKLKK